MTEYQGKYATHVHRVRYRFRQRWIVATGEADGTYLSLNGPWLDDPSAIAAQTLEDLAEQGVPTYANRNAAIRAARRVYPELRSR
jgi:hypothetical protein